MNYDEEGYFISRWELDYLYERWRKAGGTRFRFHEYLYSVPSKYLHGCHVDQHVWERSRRLLGPNYHFFVKAYMAQYKDAS